MSRPLKLFLTVVLVLVVVAGLGGLAYTQFLSRPQGQPAGFRMPGAPAQKPQEDAAIAVPVAVTRAREGAIRDTVILDGSIQAAREVSIFSNVPGKIKSLEVREGDRVERGQVLAYVERDQAGLKFADAPVESTIQGIVKKVLTERGGTVNPAAPLFQIVDIDSVEAVVHIPERQIRLVQAGLKAEVRLIAYPDRIFGGSVGSLSPVVDPASRTREAKVQVNNPGNAIKPGMFGSVEIVIRSVPKAVLVPYSGLLERQGRTLVYAVRDGKAVEVEPALDIVQTRWASVKSGIQPGEAVVVIGQHNVSDGDPVEIVEEIE